MKLFRFAAGAAWPATLFDSHRPERQSSEVCLQQESKSLGVGAACPGESAETPFIQ
jgi:hypothetical protein